MYDFDDIISNTLGGWIGQLLYIAVGYVVTHPGWRKELRDYRRWKFKARSSTLFPYTKKSGMFRTTLMGSDQAAVCDFYVNRLGFRLLQQLNRRESGDTVFLFEMGKTQVQVICSFRDPVPEKCAGGWNQTASIRAITAGIPVRASGCSVSPARTTSG